MLPPTNVVIFSRAVALVRFRPFENWTKSFFGFLSEKKFNKVVRFVNLKNLRSFRLDEAHLCDCFHTEKPQRVLISTLVKNFKCKRGSAQRRVTTVKIKKA